MDKLHYRDLIFQKLEAFYPEVLEDCKPILPEMNKVLLTQQTNGSSVLKLLNLSDLGGESK